MLANIVNKIKDTSVIVANVIGDVFFAATKIERWNEIRKVKAGINDIIISGVTAKRANSSDKPETVLNQNSDAGEKAISKSAAVTTLPAINANFFKRGYLLFSVYFLFL
jgi:predicted nucleic acid-binding protein